MMQEQIDQLKMEVDALKSALSSSGMSFDLREIIRNEVISAEDSAFALTQTYEDDRGDQFDGPAAYGGVIVISWNGRKYGIPYLYKQ